MEQVLEEMVRLKRKPSAGQTNEMISTSIPAVIIADIPEEMIVFDFYEQEKKLREPFDNFADDYELSSLIGDIRYNFDPRYT